MKNVEKIGPFTIGTWEPGDKLPPPPKQTAAEATLEMARRPDTWPLMSRLALRNTKLPRDPQGFPVLGFLRVNSRPDLESQPLKVFVGLVTADPAGLAAREFPDAAAMVAAGWVVD